VLAKKIAMIEIINMSSAYEPQPAGVELDYLEPIFEGMTPMPIHLSLVRAVVWSTDKLRAARIIRVSPMRFVKGEGQGLEPEEMERSISYNVSVSQEHRLGGFTVLSSTWIAGPEEMSAHYLGRNDFFQYFDETEAESLSSPEDIFELYDHRMYEEHLGHTAVIGFKASLSPNIYSADGLKLLAQTAPRE
jgi:hypothetical protein